MRLALDASIVGLAVYSATSPGQAVIEGHGETEDGRGHEEIYLVLKGSARFTLDDAELDAREGTFVRVAPQVYRRAIAADQDTIVLALGGANV